MSKPNITYQTEIVVRLDRRIIGEIRVEQGLLAPGETYQYFPKGQKVGGNVFSSLAACKASLEAE